MCDMYLEGWLGCLVQDSNGIGVQPRAQAQGQLHVGALALTWGATPLPAPRHPCCFLFAHLKRQTAASAFLCCNLQVVA